MFFQADTINSILNCDVCESKMVDPRLLPCGKSVCHRFSKNFSNVKQKKFLILITLGEFKILLDNLNVKKQAIESILERSDATIRDHYDKVWNETLWLSPHDCLFHSWTLYAFHLVLHAVGHRASTCKTRWNS